MECAGGEDHPVLFGCVLCVIRINQICIRNPLGQFAGFFQNILEKGEGVFVKYKIILPGCLIIIPGDDGGKGFFFRFFKLGLDDGGDFFRGVGLHIVHTFLKGVGESLNYIGMRLKIAFLCGKRGVGDITGILAERGNYIAVSFLLQGGGMGFKFNGYIYVTTPYKINLKPHILRLFLSI